MTTSSKLRRISQAQIKHWATYLILWLVSILLLRSSGAMDLFSADGAVHRAFGMLVAQLAGGFAGVSITALAIAFALPERPVLSDMRRAGHFLDLCAWLVSSIVAFLMVCVLGAFVSALSSTGSMFAALLASFVPLALITLQAYFRLAIMLINVARPS